MKTLFAQSKLVVYTDGGSRGNPGQSAIGVIISGKPYGEYIGLATNNVAEYRAVIFALKKAKAILGAKKALEAELEVRMDSQLVERQLNGSYRIEEPDLKPLFVDVWNAKMNFKKVVFKHVPREENQAADRMVNEILDEKL